MRTEDRLAVIAEALQTIGYITPETGATIEEIVEATGMARATVYRTLDSVAAQRWGINRTPKRKQPYTYYVDNATLIAYRMYYQSLQTPVGHASKIEFITDKERQAVYTMLHSFLKQAVGQFKSPEAIHKNFILELQKPSEAILEDYHKVDKSTSKLILALALAFSHLEE